MKTFSLYFFLFFISLTFSKELKKPDVVLPGSVLGEWYNKTGNGEYDCVLIHADFIEIGYQPYVYTDIIKKDDGTYVISAKNNLGKTVNCELRGLDKDSLMIKRGGSSFETFARQEAPIDGTRITITEIPTAIKGHWFTTDGKDSPEFSVEKGKFTFRNRTYEIEDIIHFTMKNNEQYRFIVKNGREYWMFYFKKFSDNYLQVGFQGKMGDLYKNNKNYPNSRMDNFSNYLALVKGEWYTTDGKNTTIVSFKGNQMIVNGIANDYLSLKQQEKGYSSVMASNGNTKKINIEPISDGYLLFTNGYLEPILIKKKKSSPDFVNIPGLEKQISGEWFTTDAKAEKKVEVSGNHVELLGVKIEPATIVRVTSGLAILDKKNRQQALISKQFPNHLEIKIAEQESVILKRSAAIADEVLILPKDLPASIKGDWFGKDGPGYWAFGISDSFLVADNALWNYKSIAYKGGTYSLTVENESGERHYNLTEPVEGISKIAKKGTSPSFFTKDKSQATLKPQNKTTDKAAETVFIQGYIKEWKTRNLSASIDFIENSIVFGTQITYSAKIDTDGKFSISFPKVYGQDIYVKYNESLYTLFVMPGDRITMSLDSENSDHPFEFMGDNAMTNYNIVDYSKEQRKIQTKDYFRNQLNHIIKDSCYVYKEYEKGEAKKNNDFIDAYLSKSATSNNFKLWAENQLKYKLADDLMRYRWYHFMNGKNDKKIVELPNDYFDFIKEYPVNLDQEIVSSNFQGFCSELKNMETDKMYKDKSLSVTITSETIIAKLEENNIKVDTTIKDLMKRAMKGEKLNTAEQKLSQDFFGKHQKFVQEMHDKMQLERQLEYFKKNEKPELFQLNLASGLYRDIENLDTLQLATVVPKKLALIEKPSFKKILSKKYQNFMEEARKPFDLTGVDLNSKNPSSGDSLLVNIANKHKGKVIYVDFWATWCGPCKAEMPHAKKLKETLKGKEVAYVYLCGSSPEPKWKQLVNQMGITGDHYFVEKNAWQELCSKFGVSGIPHYVLIDKNGVVVDKKADRPSSGAKIVNDILKLL
jgi:thiol-disulfide isomerase/thioredoxin